jgi:hypothetical protein
MVRPAVERGRLNALAWRTARVHADRVRDGSYLDVFIDGTRHWVVWSGDDPVAAYPPISRDLVEAVAAVDLSRRRRPGERRPGRATQGESGADEADRRRSLPSHW